MASQQFPYSSSYAGFGSGVQAGGPGTHVQTGGRPDYVVRTQKTAAGLWSLVKAIAVVFALLAIIIGTGLKYGHWVIERSSEAREYSSIEHPLPEQLQFIEYCANLTITDNRSAETTLPIQQRLHTPWANISQTIRALPEQIPQHQKMTKYFAEASQAWDTVIDESSLFLSAFGHIEEEFRHQSQLLAQQLADSAYFTVGYEISLVGIKIHLPFSSMAKHRTLNDRIELSYRLLIIYFERLEFWIKQTMEMAERVSVSIDNMLLPLASEFVAEIGENREILLDAMDTTGGRIQATDNDGSEEDSEGIYQANIASLVVEATHDIRELAAMLEANTINSGSGWLKWKMFGTQRQTYLPPVDATHPISMEEFTAVWRPHCRALLPPNIPPPFRHSDGCAVQEKDDPYTPARNDFVRCNLYHFDRVLSFLYADILTVKAALDAEKKQLNHTHMMIHMDLERVKMQGKKLGERQSDWWTAIADGRNGWWGSWISWSTDGKALMEQQILRADWAAVIEQIKRL